MGYDPYAGILLLFFAPVRRYPLCEKARQHVPEMVLAAEEDPENPDIVFFFNDIEPDDRTAKRDVTRAGKNVVMHGPAMWRFCKGFNICADRLDTLFGAVNRGADRLAKFDIALEEKFEDNLEITLRIRRERDVIRHTSRASCRLWRQSCP